MPRSHMLTAVFQSLVLYTVGQIIEHIFEQKIHDLLSAPLLDPSMIDPFGHHTNSTTAMDGSSSAATDAKPFYSSKLPRDVISSAIFFPLKYCWNIWLERSFPMRPRADDLPPIKTGVDGLESEAREEEIIKKWVAQGKIRRASISWGNTLIKWILEVTVANVLGCIIGVFLSALTYFHSPRWIMAEFDWSMLLQFLAYFVSIKPLVAFLSFVIIPAHERLVFDVGADLLWTVFFGLFLHLLIPWVMKREFMQEFIRDMNERAANGTITNSTAVPVADEL